MEKQVLSIKVSSGFYSRLKNNIGRGKMGEFIERVVDKELISKEKFLAKEYRECYSNPRMLEEAKKWEKAGIESWLNYEKGKNSRNK